MTPLDPSIISHANNHYNRCNITSPKLNQKQKFSKTDL